MTGSDIQSDVPEGLGQSPYFVSATLRQRLDLLHHLLEFGRQMVVLRGETRSGRTRMLEAIVDESGSAWRVLQHSGDEVATPQRLLAALTAGLGLAQHAQALSSPLARIREDLAQRQADGQVVVLAVDDARCLDASCCALLYELSSAANGSELHVLLVDDEDGTVATRLEELAPATALVHIVEVPPLTADAALDLYGFLVDRMSIDPGLSPEEALDLADTCAGNPGRYTQAILALEATSVALPPSPARARRPLQRKAMVLAALIGTGVIAGALIHSAGARRAPQPAIVEMGLPGPGQRHRTVDIVAPGSATTDEIPETGNAPTLPNSPLAHSSQAAEPVVLPQTTDAGEAEPSAYSVVAADPGNEAELPAPPGTPDDTATPPAAVAAPASKTVPATSSSAVVDKSAVSSPAQATLPPTAPVAQDVVPAPTSKPAPAAATIKSPTRPPPTPAKPSVPVSPMPNSKLATGKQALTTGGQGFVVQLFGSREQAAAQRFVSTHGLAGRATVVRTLHEGQPWYIVSYGRYANRSDAARAVATLPGALAALKPWPRAASSLQP